MPFTPNFAIPYQTLADPPDGPSLGEDGFLVVDSALAGLHGRIGTLETGTLKKLAETVLSGTAATVTFSSIPQTYHSLRLSIVCRGDAAASSIPVLVQFNGDTGANYDRQQMLGNGANVVAAEVINTVGAYIGDAAAASASTGAASIMSVDIPFYSQSTFWKQVTSTNMLSSGTGTGSLHAKLWASRRRNTAAITQIVVKPDSGNFVAGSAFTLYGLP